MIWLAVGALLLSLLLQFSSMKESELPSYALAIHAFASFVGGLTSGRRSEKKGWYNGSLLGLLYGLIVLIISFLASDASLSWYSALLLGAVLAAGAFGGMIGVNLKK